MKDTVRFPDEGSGLESEEKPEIVGCPFRAKIEACKSHHIVDSEYKKILARLFGVGKKDLLDLFQSEEYKALPKVERLGLVSSLAITAFADYVRAKDQESEGLTLDLEALLLSWENHVLSLNSKSQHSLLMDEYDRLMPASQIPVRHVNEELEKTSYTRPSSILLSIGLTALKEALLTDYDADLESQIRFINAEASTHILEPRFGNVKGFEDSGLLHRIQSFVRKIKIAIALKTKGVIDFQVKFASRDSSDSIYLVALRPRMECALKRSAELRFFVEREFDRLNGD